MGTLQALGKGTMKILGVVTLIAALLIPFPIGGSPLACLRLDPKVSDEKLRRVVDLFAARQSLIVHDGSDIRKGPVLDGTKRRSELYFQLEYGFFKGLLSDELSVTVFGFSAEPTTCFYGDPKQEIGQQALASFMDILDKEHVNYELERRSGKKHTKSVYQVFKELLFNR